MKELVYFIKHSNVSPIKIGKSTKENFKSRLGHLKISSPYGIEILGVIKTDNAYKLERSLHSKFKESRLNGEWFDISEKIIDGLLLLHQDDEFIKAKNDFIFSYNGIRKSLKIDVINDLLKNHKGEVLQQKDIIAMYIKYQPAEFIKNELKNSVLEIKNHYVNGKSKKGYKIPSHLY